MKSIRVLSVASEIYPLIKTGGLADVAGASHFACANGWTPIKISWSNGWA